MRILVLEHEPEASVGLLRDWATARGHALQITPVPRLERWPAPDECDAVISLGSESSVHASPPSWLAPELDFLAAAHDARIPVLGICFGGQALAKALGGQVGPAARTVIGWREIDSDAPELITAGPWFRWHSDRFTPPPGARLLAGADGEAEAFAIAGSIGLQFHPEVDTAIVEGWIATGEQKLRRRGIEIESLRAQIARWSPQARARALDLFDRIAVWWSGAQALQLYSRGARD